MIIINEEEGEHYVAVTEETLSVIGQSTIIRVMNSCDTAIVPCERGLSPAWYNQTCSMFHHSVLQRKSLLSLLYAKSLFRAYLG